MYVSEQTQHRWWNEWKAGWQLGRGWASAASRQDSGDGLLVGPKRGGVVR